MKIDLAIVARDLKLPPEKIEKTVELLDAGNTIPFITRFRKDLTGGLNEQQILAIKQRVAQLCALAERKTFVLKSIESQGKLTDDLTTQINKATTSRRLEDLYLPFKPKKQSRASVARQQGLEPLANDIFLATSPDVDIATRATEFVRVDKGLTSVDDVIKGVGDLLAERFSENDELRSTLRRIMWTDGKLTSQLIVVPEAADDAGSSPIESAKPSTDKPSTAATSAELTAPAPVQPESSALTVAQTGSDSDVAETRQAKIEKAPEDPAPKALKEVKADSANDNTNAGTDSGSTESPSNEATSEPVPSPVSESAETESTVTEPPTSNTTDTPTVVPEPAQDPASPEVVSSPSIAGEDKPQAASEASAKTDATVVSSDSATIKTDNPAATPTGVAASPKKKKKKKKKKKPTEDPFKDYQNFKQPIRQVPNHRILAINRGERAGRLKVKINVEGDKLTETSTAALVPAEHPFCEFMQKCAGDALNRMIVPSLEREIRRELTETAEKHAVEVFANNLRNLLLQPPIRNRTVLAIDPGFKRGCSVAVLDPCGNVLDSGHVFVVGNPSRRDESKQKIADWVKRFKAEVIAIGNGAACRQTEQMVSDTIAEFLNELQTTYVMVNEAGASTYSTSEIGRSELPDVSPSIRSAISIGRRLQDPLSELVKISPANIGVGMYQHDVKAKHLSESLDEVVRFCVNQVGVDVNSASPSLLKYVSGLNSLTARRVVEHRQANGQFKNRNQLKEISGFGDATFIQSAGFLRIHGGDTPLDCTSIHPESYEIAYDVLKRTEFSLEDLFPQEPTPVETSSQTPTPAPADNAPSTDTPSTDTPSTDAPSSDVSSCDALPSVDPSEVSPVTAASELPATESANAIPVDTPPATEPAAPVEEPGNPAQEKPAPDPAVASTPDKNDNRTQNSARRKEILKKISDLDVDELAQQHSAGKLLVKDILMALKRPNWDPRDKVNKPIFRRGIIKIDDLKPNMQIDGQVVNVVDFGVFVDIGLGESSLVHVSQLSNHFIRDPHRFYAVGDVLKVWVSEIDAERRRVKLTAVRPGSKRPPNRRTRTGRGKDSGSASASSESGQSRGSTPTPHKPGKYGNKYGGGQKGKPGQRSGYAKRDSSYKGHARKSKPKVVKPITDSMLKGDEPMRSFSDLAQFVKKKPEESKEEKSDKDASS